VLNYVLVDIGYTIKPWKFLKSWASKLLRLPDWKIEMSEVIESSHSLAGPSKRHMSTHGHYRDAMISTRVLFFVIAEVLAASTLELRRRAASFIQAVVQQIGVGVFKNEVVPFSVQQSQISPTIVGGRLNCTAFLAAFSDLMCAPRGGEDPEKNPLAKFQCPTQPQIYKMSSSPFFEMSVSRIPVFRTLDIIHYLLFMIYYLLFIIYYFIIYQ